MLIELPGGFILPLEWVIGVFVAIAIPIPFAIFGVYRMIFGGGDKGPDEEDLVALVPVDEHETIQRGKLIGNVERSEDELYVTEPDWVSDDGGRTVIPIDI